VCTLDGAVEVVTYELLYLLIHSLMVLSSIDVSRLLLWTVRSVVARDIV
jgi:hypothetical protein